MFKRVIAAFVSAVMLTGTVNIAYAKTNDLSAEFLGKSYDAASYKSDNNAISSSIDVLGEGVEFVGKTYMHTSLMFDELTEECKLTLGNDTGVFAEAALKPSANGAELYIGGSKRADVLSGLWLDVQMMYDTAASEARIVVSDYGSVIADETAAVSGEPLSAVRLNPGSGSAVYAKDITVKRSIVSSDGASVLSKCGNYVTAFAKTDKNNYIYLVQMRNGVLENVTVNKNTSDSGYAEVFAKNTYQTGDCYYVFVWNELLTPQKTYEKVTSSEFEALKASASGTLSVSDAVCGKSTVFTARTENSSAEKIVSIIKDGKSIAELDEGNLSYTFSEPGTYTAYLYENNGKNLIPAASLTFYVYPHNADTDTFIFVLEKNYYVKNGVRTSFSDGYVPLVYNGHVYLSEDVLKSLFALEFKDGKVYENGSIKAESANVSQKDGIKSASDICRAAGYIISEKDGAVCISKQSADISVYEDVMYDYLAKSSFENFKPSWNKIEYPEGWGFYDWSTSSNSDAFGAEYNDKTDGENSAYIDAVQSMFAGFSYNTKFTREDLDGYLYSCTFDVKASGDLSGIEPFAALSLEKDGAFIGIPQATQTQITGNGWQTVKAYFTSKIFNQYDFDTARLVVGIKNTSENNASGKMYIDNLKFREESVLTEATAAEIVCSDFASWYTLGDTVTYTSTDAELDSFKKIRGIVYDIDNNPVYDNVMSLRTFKNKGFTYIPQKNGYYEIEFYGIREDESESPIISCYTYTDENPYRLYTLKRHSFAVVKSSAKPMSERSDLLMLSEDAYDENRVRLADMIGFSGIRYFVPWGSTVTNKGFQTSETEFDWTNPDLQKENIDKYGFKNRIACVLSTPKWAARSGIEDKYTAVGYYYANCTLPAKNEYITNGYGAFAERYKNAVDGIEVWNEPYYNQYAFWHDGADNFVALTETAYKAIKAKAPDMTVYSAGFNLAGPFFEELMTHDNYRNSFDAISFHGRYNDSEPYRKILDNYGMGSTPLINSEGYYYAYYKTKTAKDYSVNNMAFFMHYLEQIKLGVDKVTMFEICDLTPDERRANGYGSHTMGLFRDYPYIEPHQGAVAAYNFFDNLGKNVSVCGEYDFGNGRKAVALDSDGEKQIYVWSANAEDFSCPDELIGCIGENAAILDFEGNAVNTYDFKANKMYCIKNADSEELAKLSQSKDTALNSAYVAPYYTCRDEFGEYTDDYKAMTGNFLRGALFNKDTFENGDEIIYNAESKWVSENAQTCDADYAISFDDDGMYLLVNVTDNAYCADAVSPEEITDYDSIRFAIDCAGSLRAKDRSEFSIGKVNGETVIYKIFAADKNEAAPENWHDSGSVLTNALADISRRNGKTVYKVFIPYSELYPFNCGANTKQIRFAMSVTDNNGKKVGELCFGEGLSAETAVWKYAKLTPAALSLDTVYDGSKLNISGIVYDGSDRVTVKVMYNGELFNFNQFDSLTDGKYSYSIPIDGMGEYTVTAVSSGGGRRTNTANITGRETVTVNASLGEDYAKRDALLLIMSGTLDGAPNPSDILQIEQLTADEDGNIHYTFSTSKHMAGNTVYLNYGTESVSAVIGENTAIGENAELFVDKSYSVSYR